MVLARYIEAWLLRLHGLYPPLDQCAGCGGRLPGGELRYHRPSKGFVCDACGPATGPVLPPSVREFLDAVFHRPPADLTGGVPRGGAVLEAFQQQLVVGHLERELRSYRVLRDVAREVGL